ncbi:heme-binding protein [bacterium]|nr:heme-binding protein [bacterium]
MRWLPLVSGFVLALATRPLAAQDAVLPGGLPGLASQLEARLLAGDPATLADDARKFGDAKRGAVLFYQPQMACLKCHAVTGDSPLGPVLAEKRDGATDEFLVEAVLRPSKQIRKGFETTIAVLNDGKSLTGLLVEETPQRVVLREGRADGKLVAIKWPDIDELVKSPLSIMPGGQVNQLASRQQFLDLIRYLIEIRDGGPLRAKELEPPAHLYQIRIPEYESDIDHAGLIADLDDAAFKRGEAIYNRLCINCHGTKDRPGSLPTSLKFASGKFRNGFDPYTVYQTLTRGFGMMVAQTWMVPQQKYDVIHYVREAYLRPFNPSQYRKIDNAYLAGLPKGKSRGPEPSNIEPWASMDYGPTLINTYEIGHDGSNFAYKGIAVRLDPGPGGVSRGNAWLIFDHDTLRVAGAWTGKGFIDWQGIHFNGRHQVHPRIVGELQFENPTGPGWVSPQTGSLEDPRLRGRDGKPYGPLPREWAHYKGLYHHGQRAIIEYTIGQTHILETPRLTAASGVPVFVRTFNVGPRPQPLTLQVARRDGGALEQRTSRRGDSLRSYVVFGKSAAVVDRQRNAVEPLKFDGSTFVEIPDARPFETKSQDFSITARIQTKQGGTIFSRTEAAPKWIPGGTTFFVRGGRLCFDIGWVGVVTSSQSVNDGKPHDVALVWSAKDQTARLFVDEKAAGGGRLKNDKPAGPDRVARIGFTNSNFPAPQSLFDGSLTDVRFYQRQLTAAETIKPPASDDALRGYWPLGESRNGVVADQSGNGHDGSLVRDESSAAAGNDLVVGLEPAVDGAAWRSSEDGSLLLTLPAGNEPLRFSLWMVAIETSARAASLVAGLDIQDGAEDLSRLLHGGRPHWPERVTTIAQRGNDGDPFAVDVLTRPADNPWLAQTRFTGLDFFDDGNRMAVCSWDGDVWLVSGLAQLDAPQLDSPQLTGNAASAIGPQLTWQRIASGLFQPLGLKIVDGTMHVTCRDQLVVLHDLNGDGETDFYENLNNDHQVTEHFHEFAMGLQTDAEGNFYYAKSARHALPAVVPHHGTLLKVAKDGSSTEILATGFRAANGVCLNPDGSFIVTDQEGHWNPKNRINWVRPGGFYGNMFGYHDVTDDSDDAMERPLCWITNEFDRSPAELLWCESDAWGPLKGTLLNLSYGYGQIFVVPHEEVGGQMQGGMSPLPLPRLPTGLTRGRFHPRDGQLYVCGMFAWGSNQQEPGGLYRIRYTGKPANLPLGLSATKRGLTLRFSDPLQAAAASDTKNFRVKVWSLKRSANYGSKHYNEHEIDVAAARLLEDGQTVELTIPEIAPTWSMEIRYSLRGADGRPFDGVIHNTIHSLNE